MARPRTLTDEAILETSRRLFLDEGPAVSAARIGAELDVSGPAILKRFGSKRNLLVAAFAPPEDPEWIRIAMDGPDGRPVPEQLFELADALDRFFAFVAPGFAVLRAAGLGPTDCFDPDEDAPPIRARRVLAGWFETAVDAGLICDCDPHVVTALFMSGVQSFHFVSHIMGAEFAEEAPREERLRGIVDTLWTGIAPPDSTK